jgi:hypothetical protein
MILRRIICLATLAILIAGCSALRVGYTQADVILGWRANTYFDLDADQRREFSTRLNRLLAWHRQEQLPEYSAFLTTAIGKAEPGLKHEDVAWFMEGFKSRYRTIVNRGAADAAEILATLTPEQIVNLQKQFEKDNRKFVSDYDVGENTDKRKRGRLKRMINQIEDWVGNLTGEQEQKVAALLDPIPLIEHLRHQDRMRRQHEFVALLKTRRTLPDFQPRLQEWLLAWEHGRTPEYARLYDEVIDRRIQFFIGVEKLLTREQRQHALARLQKFADDCKALSVRANREDAGTAILALF